MNIETQRKGVLYTLIGPSGVGKNTIMKAALARFSDLRQLPTATSRQMRADEQQGREHDFVTRAEFEALIEQDALVEWQVVHGELYGVPRRTVEEAIDSGKELVADIEVLGAMALRQAYPANVALIFVTAPDKATLAERIRARGDADNQEIAIRLQRANFEMQFARQCDYLIINDKLEDAAQEFIGIIHAERSRRYLANLVVSTLIHDGHEQVLIQDCPEQEDPSLPRTVIHPGETTRQAVLRLMQETGVGDVVFHDQLDEHSDELTPAYFQLAKSEGREALELFFHCEPVRLNKIAAKPGWVWRPISAIPLAETIRSAQTERAPVPHQE